eukprot:COSAG01_NODE_66529_length_269_cov_68.523529_1_plen_50_part_01
MANVSAAVTSCEATDTTLTGEGPTLPVAVRKYLEAANLPALEELKTIVAT